MRLSKYLLVDKHIYTPPPWHTQLWYNVPCCRLNVFYHDFLCGLQVVRPFDNGANAAPVSVQALSAVQVLMLVVVALKQPAIKC